MKCLIDQNEQMSESDNAGTLENVSPEIERCLMCASSAFSIIRNTTSTRVCSKCSFNWEAQKVDTKPDNINHPPHYNSFEGSCDKCGKQIECINVTRHMNFNIGNAIKYLWRCNHKGNAIEDLKKAAWYLNDEIKKRENNGTF